MTVGQLPGDVQAAAPAPAAALVLGTSLWQDAWKRLRKNRMAVAGGAVTILLVIACFLGPTLIAATWGYTYEAQNLAFGARGPSWQHWFGTDYFGRDLLTRTLSGGQISLAVGLLAATVAAALGTVYGALSGYVGGRIDGAMMRVVDIVYALPYMFLVIILVTVFDRSLVLLFLALGFVGWLTTARIVRGQVLSLKEREFVQAARSVGTGTRGILFRHLIPNALGPIIVYFTLTVPAMILQEAFLSFLGLGVQAPRPSLGALINDGAKHMSVFWWELVFPGGVMALLLFCLNFLGDGLRDALDPQMKR
ncbi:MAG TPA: ABC transporter permease [Polyangia bacterium]|jgi:oligopeptide transport system permease protein|nr:ABC transporter permease [Polyangia bacterium]